VQSFNKFSLQLLLRWNHPKQSLERAGNSRLKMTTQDELSCYFINFSPPVQKGMQKKNEEEFVFLFYIIGNQG